MATPQETLQELGLADVNAANHDELVLALRVVQDATNALEPQMLALRDQQLALRQEKLAIRAKWDELVAARALLYESRPAQPGDVVAGPGGA